MQSNYRNFGDFISQKRIERKITVRKMAEILGISPAFLTDVEKDRRNPFEKDKLAKLIEIFQLSKDEEHEMYNLVGDKRQEVAPDVQDYIMENPRELNAMLRTARDLDADEADWQRFIDELKSRRG